MADVARNPTPAQAPSAVLPAKLPPVVLAQNNTPATPIQPRVEPKTIEQKIKDIKFTDYFFGVSAEYPGALRNLHNAASDLLFLALKDIAKNDPPLKKLLDDNALSRIVPKMTRDQQGNLVPVLDEKGKPVPATVNGSTFQQLQPGINILGSIKFDKEGRPFFESPIADAKGNPQRAYISGPAEKIEKLLKTNQGLISNLQDFDKLVVDICSEKKYAGKIDGETEIKNRAKKFFDNMKELQLSFLNTSDATANNQNYYAMRTKILMTDTKIASVMGRVGQSSAAFLKDPNRETLDNTAASLGRMLSKLNTVERNEFIIKQNEAISNNLVRLKEGNSPTIALLDENKLKDDKAIPLSAKTTLTGLLPNAKGENPNISWEEFKEKGGICTITVSRSNNKGVIDTPTFKLEAKPMISATTKKPFLQWTLKEVEGEGKNILLNGREDSKAALKADGTLQYTVNSRILLEAFNATKPAEEINFLKNISNEMFQRNPLLQADYQLLSYAQDDKKITLQCLRRENEGAKRKYSPETLEISFLKEKDPNKPNEEASWRMKVTIKEPLTKEEIAAKAEYESGVKAEETAGSATKVVATKTFTVSNPDTSDSLFKNPFVKEIFEAATRPSPAL